MTAQTARQEWAARWPLPIVSMLGMSGCAIFSYANGVLLEPVTAELGWTRTEYASAFVLQMLAGLVILPTTGLLADRFGPRRIALLGIVPFAACLALLGTVGQPLWQWWALCLLLATTQGLINQPIWIASVVGWFDAGRGLALAVTLAGVGLASVIWPLLAAVYVSELGWRLTYLALALSWAVVALPLTFLFFRDPPLAAARTATSPRPARASYIKTLTNPAFTGLIVAGGLYTCATNSVVMTMVPVLKHKGFSLTEAAGMASVIGVAAITGRFLLGYLLDRLPTRPLAVLAFLLPIPAAALLIGGDGSAGMALAGCAALGFAAGAEGDVIAFVAARRFGAAGFASIFAVFTSIVAVCASLGPLLAGITFDRFQTYDALLLILMPMVACGSLIMAFIPMVPAHITPEPEGASA